MGNINTSFICSENSCMEPEEIYDYEEDQPFAGDTAPPRFECNVPKRRTSKPTLDLNELHPCSPPFLGSPNRRAMCSPSSSAESSPEISTPPCMEKRKSSNKGIIIHNGVIINKNGDFVIEASQGCLPNMLAGKSDEVERRLFHGHYDDTLPSHERGKPLHLRVAEKFAFDVQDSQNFFSFDPYFNCSEFRVETAGGKPYGNELCIKMGVPFTTLQEKSGRVLAAIKSRQTYQPSFAIYSRKPRVEGQIPSSLNYEDQSLYMWALIKKEGRNLEDEVNIFVLDHCNSAEGSESCRGPSSTRSHARARIGGIQDQPTFKSKHGFHSDTHTHTVISRTDSQKQVDVPCCLIIRDPLDYDIFNVTIAPGIDPLLILCYLAVHSKMDVEPKLSEK